jgi:hypothetical protein
MGADIDDALLPGIASVWRTPAETLTVVVRSGRLVGVCADHATSRQRSSLSATIGQREASVARRVWMSR